MHQLTQDFWAHWQVERQSWSVIPCDEAGYVATDRGRFLINDIDFNNPMEQTYVAEFHKTRELAYTYVALACTEYALTKLGLLNEV